MTRWRLTVSIVCAAILSILAAAIAPPPPVSADDTCQRSRRRRRRSRRSRGPRLTASERRAIRRRHEEPSRSAVERWLEDEPPALVLRPVNGGGEFVLTPETDTGTFGDDDLLTAETALGHRSGGTHPIDPRLLDLVYQAARHFDAPYVYVISGYRPDRATSRHTHGRAIDFVLPGVSDRRLAAWLRRLGFVGVGIYPTSGFVHLDVREHSYFWTDSSGPREDSRERPMLRELWSRYDREAREEGIEPTSDDLIDEAREAERSGSAEEGEGEGEGEGGEASESGEGPEAEEEGEDAEATGGEASVPEGEIAVPDGAPDGG